MSNELKKWPRNFLGGGLKLGTILGQFDKVNEELKQFIVQENEAIDKANEQIAKLELEKTERQTEVRRASVVSNKIQDFTSGNF